MAHCSFHASGMSGHLPDARGVERKKRVRIAEKKAAP